jgi:hypothetical protein
VLFARESEECGVMLVNCATAVRLGAEVNVTRGRYGSWRADVETGALGCRSAGRSQVGLAM